MPRAIPPIAKSAGYTPIEQNSTSSSGVLQRFHPQTDTDSLRSTIYAMLTGEKPLETTLRVNQFIDRRPSDIVMKAMNKATTRWSCPIAKRHSHSRNRKR